MSDTPRTDEVWGSMHGSGYQMMLLAQKLERELAELQNAFEDAVTAREQVEQERDKHFAASKAQNEDITALQTELAEAKSQAWNEKFQKECERHDATSHRARIAEEELEQAEARALESDKDAGRYRWMKQEVKRIPPDWAEFGWDTCIDAAIKGNAK